MEGKNLKDKVLTGFAWKFAERFLARGVSFLVSVVLARLLVPSDYGLIAMVMIFINIADVFVSSGFATALIQNKNSDETDFSTMFYCSLVMSIAIYLLLYSVAPIIAAFYNEPSLTKIMRVFAIRIPLSVLNTIQHAYVSRNMIFKKFFFSTLFGTLVSGVIGIYMALKGFGVWSLIGQYFSNTVIDTAVLCITVPWRPRWLFSWEKAKKLMNYGSKVLFADLSGTFFSQIRSFIVAKCFTSADLAYYNKGAQLPSLITTNISQTVMTVLFPALSNVGDNKKQVKEATRRVLQIMTLVVFPFLIGLAAAAKPLVLSLYTAKWEECIPFVSILAVSAAFELLSDVSLQTIKAIGRGDIVLKLEFIKKPIFILLLIIGVRRDLLSVALTMLVYSLFGASVNMFQLKKYIEYDIAEQVLDIIKPAALSFVMFVCVYFKPIHFNLPVIDLISSFFIGFLIYICGCFLIKPDGFNEMFQYFKHFLRVKGC